MQVGVGGKVTLISPQGSATAFGTVPRIRAYTVVAIFQVGFNEADTSFVYLPLDAAQIFFKLREAVTQVEVMVAESRRGRHGQPRDPHGALRAAGCA